MRFAMFWSFLYLRNLRRKRRPRSSILKTESRIIGVTKPQRKNNRYVH